MSISTTDNRVSFAGNGATTAFSYPKYFQVAADLVVILRVNSTGVETTKTITTHYTVSGTTVNGVYANGGTVTMLTAPATGETLIIYADPALTQGVDLEENDSLPAEVVEQALDKSILIAQRLDSRMDRAVRLTDGFTATFDPRLPSIIEAEKALIINAAGTAFEMGPSADEIEAAQGYATAAAASATAASGSATAAAASATAASGSATASAASAASAAATLASALWRDVVFITSASSPVTVAQADNGKLYVADTSGGAITINLPTIAGITLPFNLGVKLDAGANAVTIARSGTDTIGGATSYTLNVVEQGVQIIADTDTAPDQWTPVAFGAKDVLSSLLTTKGDLLSRSSTDLVRLGVGSNGQYLVADSAQASGMKWAANTLVTVQTFTSGSGTYTTPTGCLWLRVRMVGGGGGGSGSGTAGSNNAGNGGNTTFGTTLLVANGGAGGTFASATAAVGGTASLGSGPIGLALQGASASGFSFNGTTNNQNSGSPGAASFFGGAGCGGGAQTAGSSAIANSGSGGGGGGGNINNNLYSGSGGAAGGFVEAIIKAPSATYSYAVGAAGSLGAANTNGFQGGAGGSGYIIVEEYYA